ncbi:MAG: hypothetical protein HQ592_18810 [Planctomycetes bacterium]|nr:hypothetical protein [Planctomycetota bacterium]
MTTRNVLVVWAALLAMMACGCNEQKTGEQPEQQAPPAVQDAPDVETPEDEPDTPADTPADTGAMQDEAPVEEADEPETVPEPQAPPSWPVNRNGLLLAWGTSAKENVGIDPATGEQLIYGLEARGAAQINENNAMALGGGAYIVAGANDRLLSRCKETNELTIESIIRPDNLTQIGPARIISFSTDQNVRNFTLGQSGERLVLRLRTPSTGENGMNPELELMSVPVKKPSHVIITYKSGRTVVYLNGKQVMSSEAITGDFSNWSPQHLIFGDEYADPRDWSGTLEGIAIYSRFMEDEEATRNAELALQRLAQRRQTDQPGGREE